MYFTITVFDYPLTRLSLGWPRRNDIIRGARRLESSIIGSGHPFGAGFCIAYPISKYVIWSLSVLCDQGSFFITLSRLKSMVHAFQFLAVGPNIRLLRMPPIGGAVPTMLLGTSRCNFIGNILSFIILVLKNRCSLLQSKCIDGW
jgi:hypothetical protein